MALFSTYFDLSLSQAALDFVDIDNEADTPVYVDPYAIEIRNDGWAQNASEDLRVFFKTVLDEMRHGDFGAAIELMSHLHEPSETFLGVSVGKPKGRGVGIRQASQLLRAIQRSKAFETGILSDLSEMSLYIEGIDRDKTSDLTTNIIRHHLVDYTQNQCELFDIETQPYSGPPFWSSSEKRWESKEVRLPYIEGDAVILVPKYIVRRKLSLDSQEFYNKQITDFLLAEKIRATSSLGVVLKGRKKPTKTEVRKENPKSKPYIVEMVGAHPELLSLYKELAEKQSALRHFKDSDPSTVSVCKELLKSFSHIQPGRRDAENYHRLILACCSALFYPSLVDPKKEWEINDGRKRVDIAFTNSGESGFFAQRRADQNLNAQTVIVECKNYSDDLANPELDQLIGRFDDNRGRFGILACRSIDDRKLLLKRCRDAAVRKMGYVIVLTDADFISMLENASQLVDDPTGSVLRAKYREIIA